MDEGLFSLAIPMLYVTALLAAWTVSRPRPQPGRCATCGYDLRATSAERCPECGDGQRGSDETMPRPARLHPAIAVLILILAMALSGIGHLLFIRGLRGLG